MNNIALLLRVTAMALLMLVAWQTNAQRIDVQIDNASSDTASDGAIFLTPTCEDEPTSYQDECNNITYIQNSPQKTDTLPHLNTR